MTSNGTNGSHLGFDPQKLWDAADQMRGHMDSGEYKHVVLGLIFLKYISDAFEAKRDDLLVAYADPQNEWYIENEKQRQSGVEDDLKDLAQTWVPEESRWQNIQANAMQAEIGRIIDDAMTAIEKSNAVLKGVLPKNYARPDLNKDSLRGVINIISSIALGDNEAQAKDVLGRVYEYFLGRFAAAEGKGGGEFYTPQCVVKLLVRMIEPYKGRVFDPCCGSGGMFVQSEKFVEAHGGKIGDIAVYGQESNPTTWRLAKMNAAIRGIEADLGPHNADSFHNDLHKDLRADFILANPPFNMSAWGGERLRDDVRWKYGTPPTTNANYAWIQHFVHHLTPTGIAGFVMANGAMSTATTTEGDIRKQMIEADLIDCMVALPGQLFFTTQIPVCLWFVTRNKKADTSRGYRDRQGETLFIDARRMGTLVDRVHRELTDHDIDHIATVYHEWRNVNGAYEDKPGWWKTVTIGDIRTHHHVLTPGRFVGAEARADDGVDFHERMVELSAELYEHMDLANALDASIRSSLEVIGYGE